MVEYLLRHLRGGQCGRRTTKYRGASSSYYLVPPSSSGRLNVAVGYARKRKQRLINRRMFGGDNTFDELVWDYDIYLYTYIFCCRLERDGEHSAVGGCCVLSERTSAVVFRTIARSCRHEGPHNDPSSSKIRDGSRVPGGR